MKIIKNGDKNKLKQIQTFNCDFCGCIFEADNTEYNIGLHYNEIYCYVRCPFCGKNVYKEDY